jgi:hypothetical protein
MGELIVGVALQPVFDVAENRCDEEEHHDHRRSQVDPHRPGAELNEDRDQQRRERVQQRRPVGDVDVWVCAVVFGDQHLAVLPHPEHQREQEDQAGGQQGDADVDRQRFAQRWIGVLTGVAP